MSSSPVETVMPDCSVEPRNHGCIGVFWDVVDFPFPEGLSPHMIYDKTKLFVESLGCFGDMAIIAYVDEEQFDEKLVGAYKDAGFTIIPRQADKHTRYRSVSLDIDLWNADMHFEGLLLITLMVVSKEIEKKSPFFTFLQSMTCLCQHVLLTLDHDPPPSGTGRLQRICFSIPPLETIGQSGTLLGSSDGKRKRTNNSLYYSHESLPRSLSIPDSPVQSTSEKCSTHVFWDGVDFPLPYNDPHYAFRLSQSTLKELDLHAASSLVAYVDEADLCGERETDGITIIPCQGDEEARSHAMLVDIVLWAMENHATYFEPKTLMVVSKDMLAKTDYLEVLEALSERHYTVVLGEPPNPQILSSRLDLEGRFVREEVVGFSNGLATLYRTKFMSSDVFIFWDVLGCPTDFSSVERVLHDKGYDGKVIVEPYVDEDYGDYGDNPFDEKTTPRRVLFKPIIRVTSKEPFEDDTRCSAVIQALESRGYNIIFRPSDQVTSIDKSNVGSFSSLCKRLPVGAEVYFNPSIKSQGRILTDQSIKLASQRIVVFLLVQNCPYQLTEIWYNFMSVLEKKGYEGIMSTCTVFTDTREFSEAYDTAGVYIKPFPKEDECGKVTSLLMEMISWGRGLREPANFLVISEPFKDPICDKVVESLKIRGCNVLFELPDYMLTFGHSRWSAKCLLRAD
ncbi:unnamed protein product [Microthlaspi erraticum]|uniref:NYN domain-containing protein n=1 Tax=Microthlaspi erraticum TaxID=1685480 RepID=A0A6D2KF77_9BRAS|nr:unnamed protein product [Microthlaspi erraticum]